MKDEGRLRVVITFNRDYEGAEADPENRAREDIRHIADHVAEVLGTHGHQAIPLGITDDVLAAMVALRDLRPDVVFNLCESICGDARFEPLLPLLLEKEGLAFTGSGPLALTLALHKDRAKEILRARGVPTPESVLLASADVSHLDLAFPLIVKPSREDASVGISSGSVVRDAQALRARVALILSRYRQPALVERYIEGREIYVSLLERVGAPPQVLPFHEIDFSEMPPDLPRIVSFEGKWVEDSVEYRGTKPVRCADLSPEVEARVTAAALAAFQAMEIRDYGRVDLRLAEDGTPYVIDVNPNCDLSALGGGFSRAAKAAGLGYDGLILRILELAYTRRPNADTIPLAPRSRSARRPDQTGGAVSPGGDLVRDRAPRRRARSG